MPTVRAAGTLLAVFLCVRSLAAADAAEDIPRARREHWAWKPPAPQLPPPVHSMGWVRNPIDRFILGPLENAGLQPARPASRAQLLRRVTFDLIGLPPTPEQIGAFVRDPSPQAWERVIDRLLASPHYGERWGRHWLDLARFAESNGYEFDEMRPDAWRYRDYVIRALNADKPYHRFIREQVAGDELYPDDLDARIATGFNLLGPDMTDSSDQRQRRLNTLNDMTDTVGLVYLGLTIACARCHDHKFEPIPQADYYRMQAFFAPASFRKDLPVAERPEREAYEQALRAFQTVEKPIRDELARLEEPHRQRLYEDRVERLAEAARHAHRTPEGRRTVAQQELVAQTLRFLTVATKQIRAAMSADERARAAALDKELAALAPRKPAPLPMTMGLMDAASSVPKTYLLERGELTHPASELLPGFPLILNPQLQAVPASIRAPHAGTTGRRAALAEWLARPDHPLTARVLVNRLWQHHFGRGLVATASDFGVRGELPTHPELLDWLATEFVAHGWSIKHIHRLMLTSSTYLMSSITDSSADPQSADPDNRLFSRMNRVRLEGEIIRDSLLALSGRLNRTMEGPSVFPPVPPDAPQGSQGWKVTPDSRAHSRRSIYIFARRNVRFPFLEIFDLPDSNLSCPQRERSTTAPQALALMNADDTLQAAQALACRLEQEAPTTEERILRAYRLVLGREPSAMERQRARDFLRASPLSELCRGLFNVNEFVYLD